MMSNFIIILFFLCLICLMIGFIRPELVIRWGEKRDRKRVLIYYGIGLILIFVLFGVTLPKDSNTSTSTKDTMINNEKIKQANKKKEEEEKLIIKNLQEKYKPILESGKDYSNMTNEEGDIAVEMISKWYMLDDNFKMTYQNNKDNIEKSIQSYNDKKLAEAKEKRKAEEAVAYDTGITYEQLARTPDDYKGKKAKFTGKVIQVMEGNGETDLRVAVNGNYDTILLVAYNPKIVGVRILENDNITVKGVSKGIYTYNSTIGGKISIPLLLGDKIELNQ